MGDTYVFRWLKVQTYKILRQFVKLRATPHAIALGTAIGVFVSMTPTIGLQMIMGVIIATIVGANRIAAALPAWITNPFTIVPIYSFNYWLGTLLVKGPGLEDFKQELIKLDSIKAVYNLGTDILLPLCIGCSIVGLVLAIPTYPIMFRLVVIFRKRLDRRKNERHSRVIDILIRKGLLKHNKKGEESDNITPDYPEKDEDKSAKDSSKAEESTKKHCKTL